MRKINLKNNQSLQLNRKKVEEYTKYIKENFAPRMTNLKKERIKKEIFYLENIQEKNYDLRKKMFAQGVDYLRNLPRPKRAFKSRDQPIVKTKFENYLGTFDRESQVLIQELIHRDHLQLVENLDKDLQEKHLDKDLYRNIVEAIGVLDCVQTPSYSSFFHRSV